VCGEGVLFYEPFGLRDEKLSPLRGGSMGRILMLSGIAILGYGYYTNTTDDILSLIAFVLISMGAIFYFLTGFK
jgi:hypothetical protein